MNKKHKLFLVVLSLLLLNKEAFSQKVKGISSVGISLAKSDFGYMFGTTFDRYLSAQTKLKGEVYYELSNTLNMKHSSYYLNAYYLRDFFDSRDENVVLFGIGATANYDQLDKDIELGNTFVRNTFNVGIIGKVQYEHYLSKKMMFQANGVFNYNVITEFSKTKFWGGVGINYLIY